MGATIVAQLVGALVPALAAYAVGRWHSGAVRAVHGAVASGAVLAFLLYAAAPALRAVLPLVPSRAPVMAAIFYAALPEEILKLGGLALVARRPSILVQAIALACGFAAGENVLVLGYAAQPLDLLVGRVTVDLPAHMALGALAARAVARLGLSLRGFAVALLITVPLHAGWDALFFAGWDRTGIAAVALAAVLGFLAWR